MKYFPRLGLYKASNVTFNPRNLEAYSYSWWQFVKIIDDVLVFNSYTYSNTTTRHQWKVRHVLRELGYTEWLEIESPRGLQDLSSAVRHYEQLIQSAHEYLAKPRIRETSKFRLLGQIDHYEAQLDRVRMLMGERALCSA